MSQDNTPSKFLSKTSVELYGTNEKRRTQFICQYTEKYRAANSYLNSFNKHQSAAAMYSALCSGHNTKYRRYGATFPVKVKIARLNALQASQ